MNQAQDLHRHGIGPAVVPFEQELNARVLKTFRPELLLFCLLSSQLAHARPVAVEGDLNDDLRTAINEALVDEAIPRTVFEGQRQLARAEKTVRDVLNSQGWFDPEILPRLRDEESIQPVLDVDPGQRFLVSEINLVFEDDNPREDDVQAVRNALPLQPDDWAIPKKILESESIISRTLQNYGYAFARVDRRQVAGDRDAGTVELVYNVKSGPRVAFGDVDYPDDIRTKVTFLERFEPIQQGELYAPAKLIQFNARLSELRMFDRHRAALAKSPSGRTEEGDLIYDVELTLEERSRNTVTAGAKFSTSEGFGLAAGVTRRNIIGRADIASLDLEIAEIEQALTLEWRRPHEFGYNRALVLSSDISNEMTDGYDRQAFGVGAGVDVVRSEKLSYNFGLTGEVVAEEDDFGERTLQIIEAYAGFSYDASNSKLNATRGWRLDGRVQPGVGFGSETSQYVRLVSEVRGYQPFGDADKFVIAARLKAGSVLGASLASLSAADRFYSGGGGSVRGYAYQALGPRSADNDPTGGLSLVEGAVEARWKARGALGFVGFVDFGTVSVDALSGFEELQVGAGVGVRYDTPAGPFRFDVGVPLNKQEGDGSFQIYLSLGQAF